MDNGITSEQQLALFRKRLSWQELPRDVRERTLELLTALSVEVVSETPFISQEEHRESED